jgi:hypothetical protein
MGAELLRWQWANDPDTRITRDNLLLKPQASNAIRRPSA